MCPSILQELFVIAVQHECGRLLTMHKKVLGDGQLKIGIKYHRQHEHSQSAATHNRPFGIIPLLSKCRFHYF